MKTLLLALLTATTLTTFTPTAANAHGNGHRDRAVQQTYAEVCHRHRSARHCHVVEGRDQYVVGAVNHHRHRGLVRKVLRQQRRQRLLDRRHAFDSRRGHGHTHGHSRRHEPEVTVTVRERRRSGNVRVQGQRSSDVTVIAPTTRQTRQRQNSRRTSTVTTVTRSAPVVVLQGQVRVPADEHIYRPVHDGNEL